MNIKTLDLIAKIWLDRPNGNRYFTAQLTINFQLKGERTFYMPFDKCMNQSYEYEAVKVLIREGLIPATYEGRNLWSVCHDEKIIKRVTAYEKCKRKDVEAFGVKQSD
jgi:hypothetical protein